MGLTRVLDRWPSDLPVREMPNAILICNNFLMCRVNQVHNEDEECSAPAQSVQTQSRLLFSTRMFIEFILQVVVHHQASRDCSAVVSPSQLADQRATARICPPTSLHDTPGYVQNIRSLEYGAC